MTEHAEMVDFVKFQNRVIKNYERITKISETRLKQLEIKVKEQADLIVWLSNKHEGFYKSEAWLEIRIRVLDTYGPVCMCCGSTAPDVVIHVDHIKPFSLFPELALDFENLQVLCENCNRGKSNKIMNDYRPKRKVTA